MTSFYSALDFNQGILKTEGIQSRPNIKQAWIDRNQIRESSEVSFTAFYFERGDRLFDIAKNCVSSDDLQ